MKTIIYIALLCSLAGVFSCQNQTNSNNTKAINSTITVDEFEKKLSDADIQLVDVRTLEEYNQGHLHGSLNYDINATEFEDQISGLDKNKQVLVYCRTGSRSQSAAEILAGKGFREVYNMKGGIMKWNASDKAIEEGAASPKKTEMTEKGFEELLKSDKYVLVDYNAKWCKPCLKMAPVLDGFTDKRKEKLVLVKIDADENKNLLKQKGIESLPVLELYKDGKLLWKHEGEIDEKTLIREVKL